MFSKRIKPIVFSLLFCIFVSNIYGATTDLTMKFLNKASEAYEEGNIEDAYKYVNQALAVANDKDSQMDVIYFAQTVYKIKLQKIQEKYDDMALIDIKMNLEKYPNVENATIKKLIKQIEQTQEDFEKFGKIASYINDESKSNSSIKEYALEAFNGISFGATVQEANKIMLDKGWNIKTRNTNTTYTNIIYENGNYAGITGATIVLSFFKDKFWNGNIQIKTYDYQTPVLVLNKLEQKYSLESYYLKGENRQIHILSTDTVNRNYIDTIITVSLINNQYLYFYDIHFYSNEIKNAINEFDKNIHGDDL